MTIFSYYRNILGFCCLVLYTAQQATGSGFALIEHSAKELGQAFSGASTNTSDGSMVFFNPAAMSQVKGQLFSAVGHIIMPSIDFKNESSRLSPSLGGSALRGGDGKDPAEMALIPNLYYVNALTDRLSFGLAVNTPFGMSNSYQSGWVGRYHALKSELMTINVNPALSWKLTENLSLGAGFNVQYLKTKLTNALDFGTICLANLPSPFCAGQGLLPQEADGHVTLKGDSVGVGYNVGLFYAPSEYTHFGVSYRSSVKHNLRGNADYTVPDSAGILTRNNVFVDSKIRSSITLPDHVQFGFSHRFNPQWAVSSDITWTNWSHMRELRVDFASNQPDSVQPFKWKDTWRYAVGVNYTPQDSRWAFRTGFAYDQSPVPNAQLRSPRVPDNDRYWVTAGVSYALANNINLHGAYAYLFVSDAAINSTGPTRDQLIGQFSTHVHIVGLQLDWRF